MSTFLFFSASSFSDSNLSEAPWVRADLNVQLIKYISVGPGGIFASQAKDDTVWCRYHMQSGKATTKVNMDEGKGHGWNKIANVSTYHTTRNVHFCQKKYRFEITSCECKIQPTLICRK